VLVGPLSVTRGAQPFRSVRDDRPNAGVDPRVQGPNSRSRDGPRVEFRIHSERGNSVGDLRGPASHPRLPNPCRLCRGLESPTARSAHSRCLEPPDRLSGRLTRPNLAALTANPRGSPAASASRMIGRSGIDGDKGPGRRRAAKILSKCIRRSDRSAQGDRPTLRSIRPKQATATPVFETGAISHAGTTRHAM
jgi:hypothetical protein